jgi:phosphate:Na+ symporter
MPFPPRLLRDYGRLSATGTGDKFDDILDRLNTAINPDELSDEEHRRARELLAFTINLEHAGDIVEKNLLGIVTKKLKRGVGFTKAGQRNC